LKNENQSSSRSTVSKPAGTSSSQPAGEPRETSLPKKTVSGGNDHLHRFVDARSQDKTLRKLRPPGDEQKESFRAHKVYGSKFSDSECVT
jgi:hypothetical protein